MTPAPSPLHQRVSRRLQRQLEDDFQTRAEGFKRRLACDRAEAGGYALVTAGEGERALAHPDWPGLTLGLGDLWR